VLGVNLWQKELLQWESEEEAKHILSAGAAAGMHLTLPKDTAQPVVLAGLRK